ncbi:MAG: SIS domain-containing protein [Candidatus Woykebacteria bacterium]
MLDDIGKIKKIDSKDMAGSIMFLKDQVKSAWEGSKTLQIPESYKSVQNIVVAGMGGSALGPHIVRSVYDIPVPFQIVNEYSLPSFVNENTLVIVSSYSGTTEETLSALQDAIRKKAKIVGIGSGGKLIADLNERGLPFYQFDTKYNPSGNPRLGLGFSIAGVLGILSNLNLVQVTNGQIEEVIYLINKLNSQFDVKTVTRDNVAKQKAEEMLGKIFIVVAGPFLAGNAHAFANQINESAKVFGGYFLLSELDHHLLEGITYPDSLKNVVKFFNFESDLYEERIKTRMQIGNELLDKYGLSHTDYKVKAAKKDLAAFEALTFSSWTSFYMGISNEADPSLIPNVDFFKDQLAKSS